jgi:hypothetical protein
MQFAGPQPARKVTNLPVIGLANDVACRVDQQAQARPDGWNVSNRPRTRATQLPDLRYRTPGKPSRFAGQANRPGCRGAATGNPSRDQDIRGRGPRPTNLLPPAQSRLFLPRKKSGAVPPSPLALSLVLDTNHSDILMRQLSPRWATGALRDFSKEAQSG